MNKSARKRFCDEVDEYLQTEKSLKGLGPVQSSDGHNNEMHFKWPIEERTGIERSYLDFRINRMSTGEPSVSLIYSKKPICRVDIKSASKSDGNPAEALKLGLPLEVNGPHIHKW